MPQASRSPLDDTDRLIVDGSNLLYRLGGSGAPPSTIIGRLRAAVPVPIAIELFFDGVGHGVTGRVAQNMRVRYSGQRTGDEAILELVGDGLSSPVAAARTLVVTDDRDLRIALASRGARTAGVVWLLGRMGVSATGTRAGAAPAQGRGRAAIGAGRPSSRAGEPNADDAARRPGWRPGRGATAKTGTAHKVPRHRRHPRNP